MITRRKISKLLGAALPMGVFAPLSACDEKDKHVTESGSLSDLSSLALGDAARKIFDGDLTALEYAEALIKRTEEQASLNAYISFDADRLRDAAKAADAIDRKGVLNGIPLAIKDNIDVAGWGTTAGTGALKDYRPDNTAPAMDRLLETGAIVSGKTNMHELAFGVTSANDVFGVVRNPYDLNAIPGGSSGGTAAAVAARMVPAGLGTDTGGSCRIPPALCGVVGFRPTMGRYPAEGVVNISHTRDTVGPIARTVEDIQLLDQIMADEYALVADMPGPGGIKIGVPRGYFWDDLDPEVARVSEAALEKIAKLGFQLVEIDIPNIAELTGKVGFPIVLYEALEDIQDYLAKSGSPLTLEDIVNGAGSQDVREVFAAAMGEMGVPEEAYLQALNVDRPKLQATYASYFKEHDVAAVVFPTTPLPARPMEEGYQVMHNGELAPIFPTYIRNTDPGSNAGIPGITIPSGMTGDGLPVGLALDGPAGSDPVLLVIAGWFEEVVGPLPPPGV